MHTPPGPGQQHTMGSGLAGPMGRDAHGGAHPTPWMAQPRSAGPTVPGADLCSEKSGNFRHFT